MTPEQIARKVAGCDEAGVPCASCDWQGPNGECFYLKIARLSRKAAFTEIAAKIRGSAVSRWALAVWAERRAR